jgi:hypothetical protein
MRTHRTFLAISLVLATAQPFAAQALTSAPLAAQRDAAYSQLRSGDVMGGAMTLLAGLRSLPDGDLAAIDQAIEPFHLLAFTVDFLMDAEQQTQFITELLEPEEHDMDHFLQCVFWYNLDTGLDKDEVRRVHDRLRRLSYSDNATVRAGALFMRADPYYSYSTATAFLGRKKLNEQFPHLNITRVAFRMPVLNRRHNYAEALEAWQDEREDELVRENMGADPVLQLIAPRLPALKDRDAEGKAEEASGLLAQVRTAADWEARYSALLMAEPLIGKGLDTGLKPVCMEWAQRTPCTPDVVRAHIALINLARAEDNADELAYWGEALSALEFVEDPIERNLYEDIMKSALQAGGALAELGAVPQAVCVYRALERKFPNSALAAVCAEHIAAAEARVAP